MSQQEITLRLCRSCDPNQCSKWLMSKINQPGTGTTVSLGSQGDKDDGFCFLPPHLPSNEQQVNRVCNRKPPMPASVLSDWPQRSHSGLSRSFAPVLLTLYYLFACVSDNILGFSSPGSWCNPSPAQTHWSEAQGALLRSGCWFSVWHKFLQGKNNCWM